MIRKEQNWMSYISVHGVGRGVKVDYGERECMRMEFVMCKGW